MKKIIMLILIISVFTACSNNTKQTGSKITKKKEYKSPYSFQITAANAKEVFLEFQNSKKMKMGKAAEGKWFKNLQLKPGKLFYRYIIDGEYKLDKNHPFQIEDISGEKYSYIIIEKENPFTIPNNKSNGKIDKITIKTKNHGDNYPFNVYLPPDYDSSKKYPLLFLMHGYGQNQNTWIINGVKEHMDNLIAKGYIKPFIIVMPLTDVQADNFYDFEPFRSSNYEYLIRDEIYGYVKDHYSIYTNRDKTAISGFSMGGTMSFGFAVNNQDLFGFAVPQAGWFPQEAIGELNDEYNKNGFDTKLSIYCGRDDDLYPVNKNLSKALEEKNIDFKYHIYPGGHTGEFTVSIMKEVLMEISDFFYRY